MAAVPAVPAKAHKRTNAEEVDRLKRKYTGLITQNGQAKTAFTAVFGDAIGIQLPQSFADIVEVTGHAAFHPADVKPAEDNSDTAMRRRELQAMKRPELCALAVDTYKLKVKVADSNDDIIDGILEAEAKIAEKNKPKEEAA